MMTCSRAGKLLGFILLSVFIHLSAAATDRDPLYADMMQYYAFVDCNPSSQVLRVELIDKEGKYLWLHDDLGGVITLAAIEIWWPDFGMVSTHERDVITSSVLSNLTNYPLLEELAETSSYDHQVYVQYRKLKGLRSQWDAEGRNELKNRLGGQSSEGDRISACVKVQQPCFQSLQLNKRIASRLQEMFRGKPRPEGLHLFYCYDPNYRLTLLE